MDVSMPELHTMSTVVAVVDDDPRIRDLLKDELLDEGVIPVLCASGNEMLEAIKQSDVQLILLDLMMPGMDGVQCLKRLRSESYQGAVVVVTALADDELRRQVMAEGAVEYIVKTDLFQSLAGVLNRNIASRK